jgi:hypothetical protein
VITAAGVSAGIDMALILATKIAGQVIAQSLQLAIEYDPAPPFDSGSPEKAPHALAARMLTAAAGELSVSRSSPNVETSQRIGKLSGARVISLCPELPLDDIPGPFGNRFLRLRSSLHHLLSIILAFKAARNG